jgi:ABC-2 type transport system ATP-binding protein
VIQADDATLRGQRDAHAVECKDLVVRYGTRTALNGVSFVARRGEVLCILGPNGAGKTSTVECIEGYRRPASGTVRVLGLDPVADHRMLVARIGVMLQRGGVYPMLGPARALRLFAAYYDDHEDPEDLLDLVKLRAVARTPWRHLSGGEQARLSLALALVGRPEVLLLDEPTAGVDPEGRVAVREVITSLRDRGACVILTTHELAEAERVADRVLMLTAGTVAAEGSPTTLMGAPEAARETAFGAAPGLDLAELVAAIGAGARVTEELPGRYRVVVTGQPAEARSAGTADLSAGVLAARVATWLAQRKIAFSDLRVGRSLEEAYLDALRANGGQPQIESTQNENEAGSEVAR